MINHYRVLRVRTTATPEELRIAKKKRALETHPDRGGSVADFEAVTTAYAATLTQSERASATIPRLSRQFSDAVVVERLPRCCARV